MYLLMLVFEWKLQLGQYLVLEKNLANNVITLFHNILPGLSINSFPRGRVQERMALGLLSAHYLLDLNLREPL